jgi:cell division protease FtsH
LNTGKPKDKNENDNGTNKKIALSIWFYIIAIALVIALQLTYFSKKPASEISYREFREAVDDNNIQEIKIGSREIIGKFKDGKEFRVIALPDEKLVEELQKRGIDYRGIIEDSWFKDFLLSWILPLALLFVLWGFLFRRIGPGTNVLGFGKSKAKLYTVDEKTKVTFKDVAGIDEVIEEVQEVVNFLKDPKKFQKLGGKLPKGVLLVGPPGTGKTLLAKAVAGEANVPFFSLSGSDFVEMFVGVGAARVRDLFSQAKSKAPCIIFIDEIDAIGRSRAKGMVFGGYDERENTLNQLLAEMDGFNTEKGVIITAATNRPDVLDPALLRPGRFDRQILVDKPDLIGREAIFKIHTRDLILSENVDLHVLAAQTPGFAGAEIANVCNEAALLASRNGKEKIEMNDFQSAIERVIAGLEKKSKVINEKERKIVAFHESGHALVGYFLPNADAVHKVSIIPRGLGALGYTLQTPLEDRYLLTQQEILDRIASLLGGRASEEVVFGSISTGAHNDLEKATELARNMVTVYGMSEKIGQLSFAEDNRNFLGGPSLTKPYSEETAKLIDDEVKRIIDESYIRAKDLISQKRDKLNSLAQELLEKEIVEKKDIERIFGPKGETATVQVQA